MKSICVKVFVAILLVAMLSGVCSALSIKWLKKPGYAKPPEAKRSVLAFPFDDDMAEDVPEEASGLAAAIVKSELQNTGKFHVLVFSERLAPIQRAIEVDSTFASARQVEPPYADDKIKTLAIARVMQVDYALCGVIEDYEFDTPTKTVTVLLSAEMIDVMTGRIVAAYTVTGKATATGDFIDEQLLTKTAIEDGISKLNLDQDDEEDSDD